MKMTLAAAHQPISLSKVEATPFAVAVNALPDLLEALEHVLRTYEEDDTPSITAAKAALTKAGYEFP